MQWRFLTSAFLDFVLEQNKANFPSSYRKVSPVSGALSRPESYFGN